MREIKFRAWNKEQNVMCYDNEDDTSYYWDGVRSSIISLINYRLNRGDYDFMQYTGLKDNAKRELYDGDICQGDEGKIYQIVWMNDYAKWGVKVVKTKNVLTRGQIFPLHQYLNKVNGRVVFEVIGNIHENPSLLEEN